MKEESIFKNMIYEICQEKGIDYQLLSFNWIIELKKDDKIRHIVGNRFDLNPESSAKIACDKYATYLVLNANKVPSVEHRMFFNISTRNNYVPENGIYSDIIAFFQEKEKVVIKPNSGSEGLNVFLCSSLKEVEEAINTIFKSSHSLSVCPFYNIKTEFRTIVLNGEVKLIYGKERPYVVGDGVSSVGTLLKSVFLPNKRVVEDNLKNINFEYVPKKGEKVMLSWKFNLSGGAYPKLLEKGEMYNKLEKLALDAARVTNIKFASIDIIQEEDDSLFVLEINSGVCTSLFLKEKDEAYDLIKSIYSEAIDEMFK